MTRKAVRVVTIDGPSGSGKGTIGRLLAQKLGWHYLDSGALYRLVALAALRRHLDFRDAARLAAVAAGLDARFASAGGSDRVYLEGAYRGQVNGEIQGTYSDLARYEELSDPKYTDTGGIFDIMAVTVIQNHLATAV